MMNAGKRRFYTRLLWTLLVLTLCFIWGNSLLPRRESSQISGRLLELLRPLFQALKLDHITEHVLRKLAHFSEFAALGAELAGLFFLKRGRRLRSAVGAALCALGTAALDECLQFLSARAPMLKDVLLDFAGAVSGIALLTLLTSWISKRNRKNGLPD